MEMKYKKIIFTGTCVLLLGSACIKFQNTIKELDKQIIELKSGLDDVNQELKHCEHHNQQLQEQLSEETPNASSIIRQLEIDLYKSEKDNDKFRDEISNLERESRSEYRRLQQKYGN
jgi:septal ring factor EnvC (AmiA/AmiB activator)